MRYLAKYEIAFKGLKEGKHEYEFDIDERFFEKFENNEVTKGDLKAEVTLNKQSNLMIIDMYVSGTVELLCDRCLEYYPQEVENESKIYIKFGDENEEMSDEVLVITFDQNQINVAQYLYELIILGLPIKHVHPDDQSGKSTCDPEMLEKLKEYLVEEVDEEEQEDLVDERWSELKKLLDNK
ncbi:MAG: DUF177 domain-containing protein [Prolixibacteraceae bacterium]